MGLGFSSAGAGAFDSVQELLAQRLEEELEAKKAESEEALRRSQARHFDAQSRLKGFQGDIVEGLVGPGPRVVGPGPRVAGSNALAVAGQPQDTLGDFTSSAGTPDAPRFRAGVNLHLPLPDVDPDDSTDPNERKRLQLAASGLFNPNEIMGSSRPSQAVVDARRGRELDVRNSRDVTKVSSFDPGLGRNRDQFVLNSDLVNQAGQGRASVQPPLQGRQLEVVTGASEALAILERMRPMAENVLKLGLIGPVAGRIARLSQGLPNELGGSVNADFAGLTSETERLVSRIVRALSGAQVSDKEAQRIMSQVPDLTRRPERFQIDFDATVQNLQDLLSATTQGVSLDSLLSERRRGFEDAGGNVAMEILDDATR